MFLCSSVLRKSQTHFPSISDDVIPNATLRTDLSSLGALSEAYSIPCNSSLSFGLVVDSQNFIMDESTLVVELPDGTCVSAIEGWADPTVSTYLFGSRFISTIYLYVQYSHKLGDELT